MRNRVQAILLFEIGQHFHPQVGSHLRVCQGAVMAIRGWEAKVADQRAQFMVPLDKFAVPATHPPASCICLTAGKGAIQLRARQLTQ